jgi:Tfp pilus assembly protein PilV
MRKIFFQQSGLSLIEVLLVTGMVALLGFSFASIINNQQNISRNLQQTLEANQVTDAVRAFLNQYQNCDANFRNAAMNAPSTFYTELKNGANTPVFTTGPTSTVGDQIYLEKIELVGPAAALPGLTQSAMILKLYYGKRTDSAGGVLKPRQLELMVEGAGTVTSCAAKTPKTPNCVPHEKDTGGTSISVWCSDKGPQYRVFGCGWKDDNPTKTGNRYFYPIQPYGTGMQAGGGCFCRDTDPDGRLYCYALCCAL